MNKLLAIALTPSDAEACAALGAALGIAHDLLLLTGSISESHAGKVLEAGLTEVPTAAAAAPDIAKYCEGYTHVAAVSSMASKDLMARVAGLLDAGMVTDVVAVHGAASYIRPVVAGSALATVEVLEFPVVMTFRPAGFGLPSASPKGVVGERATVASNSTTERHRSAKQGKSRPDLTQAKVVVSGGRPLKDAETFERVIGGLADKLGGAVGATRAAVDSGIASNDLQVGQTGKVVSPGLYIACGISGSTQHMAGIKDSKVIVAINSDPDAAIFDSADFGLVADLYQAIPELMTHL